MLILMAESNLFLNWEFFVGTLFANIKEQNGEPGRS